MAAAAGWAGTIAVALRGITGTRGLLSSLAWLSSGHHPGPQPPARPGPCFVLILPLLREQQMIASTTGWLAGLDPSWGQSSVALVTTEREHAERLCAREQLPRLAAALSRRRPVTRFLGVLPQDRLDKLTHWAGRPVAECLAAVRAEFAALDTTPALAARLASGHQGQMPVRHYHLPDPAGSMAGQVNHAARAELSRLRAAGRDPGQVWLAVYNADSRPGPATLAAVAAHLATHPDTQIIQQPAVYTCGPGAGVLADGAALLQSRWTLAREIPRLRRQAARTRAARAAGSPAGGWPRLAHCVGHGLFVRGDVFTRLGGLPAATMNEDLAFGYLACAAGIPIDPLPVLEHAAGPGTAAAVVRQARQWFWSYPQYMRAAGLAARAGLGTRWSRTALAAQGLARGTLWLAQSPAVAAAIALPLAARRRGPAAAAAAGAVAAYYGVPFAVLARHLRRGGQHIRLGPRELAGGLAACLASSLGPWWCLGQMTRARLTGRRYTHGKTER